MRKGGQSTISTFASTVSSAIAVTALTAGGCSGNSGIDTASNGGDGGTGVNTPDASASEAGAAGDSSADHNGSLDAPGDTAGDQVATTCGDGVCSPSEDCSGCEHDCGPCAASCGDGVCGEGETCTTCPSECGACPATCPNGACEPEEDCTTCQADCGSCSEADVLSKCTFDPMQWWRGAGLRDVTFVAFGDPHASDPTPGCPVNEAQGANQNVLIREAINSAGAQPHVWPTGASFYREGQVYDHIRGALILGDLTQAGSESIPAGTQTCREYTAYRNAFGRCGAEGKLNIPVYDLYGNHDFPRAPLPATSMIIQSSTTWTGSRRPTVPGIPPTCTTIPTSAPVTMPGAGTMSGSST